MIVGDLVVPSSSVFGVEVSEALSSADSIPLLMVEGCVSIGGTVIVNASYHSLPSNATQSIPLLGLNSSCTSNISTAVLLVNIIDPTSKLENTCLAAANEQLVLRKSRLLISFDISRDFEAETCLSSSEPMHAHVALSYIAMIVVFLLS